MSAAFRSLIVGLLGRFSSTPATSPGGSGIPTICPPVTPDWELLTVTTNFSLSPAGWDSPDVVDDDLE